MSGYRDRSGFDPMAGGSYGPPLRPYNWVQWAGVAIVVAGIALALLHFAAEFGLASRRLDPDALGLPVVLIGSVLINSRRQEVPLSAEARRRNGIILGVMLAVCLAVAALVILLKGAGH